MASLVSISLTASPAYAAIKVEVGDVVSTQEGTYILDKDGYCFDIDEVKEFKKTEDKLKECDETSKRLQEEILKAAENVDDGSGLEAKWIIGGAVTLTVLGFFSGFLAGRK